MPTWPAKTNYATGDVLTAAEMQDIGNALNSVGSAQYAAGKNKIINGDFFINQRGFTTSTTSGQYMVDRFTQIFTNIGSTGSVEQFTVGTSLGDYNPKQHIRFVTTGQTAVDTATILNHRIEDVRTLAGEVVTLSFWAKAASGTPKIAIETDQGFGTGGSPSTRVRTYQGQVTLSTTWEHKSLTFTVPSISGKTLGTNNDSYLGHFFWMSSGSNNNANNGSLGIQSNTFDIWGVQLEVGNVATAFQTATGTLAGELSLAQRYYWRLTPGTGGRFIAQFGSTSGTDTYGTILNPTIMRTKPTSVDYSALNLVNAQATTFAVTSITNSPTLGTLQNSGLSVFVGSGLSVNDWFTLAPSSDSGYIGFSAEL